MRLVPSSNAAHRKRSLHLLAFSLVEVLMGVDMVGGTVVAFYTGISSGFSVVQLFRENLRATQILAEKMETTRLDNRDQFSSFPGTSVGGAQDQGPTESAQRAKNRFDWAGRTP